MAYALRWPALFVILAAEVMDLLDALITSIAGPTIVRDLGGGETLIQWLAAGYTIAMASGLLIGGRLGDIYGRRRMFMVGMAGFTLMSLACALSQSPEMLIVFRVLQGLVGAVMLPQGLGMIKEMFPPDEIAGAFGAFGPIMGLSAVGGPILAGWLVDADLFGWGWRTIFAINIPIGVVALLVAARVLPPSRPDRSVRIDLTSAAIASGAMVLLIYPLIQGREHGWPLWSYLMIAAGAAMFALLAVVERRRDRAGLVDAGHAVAVRQEGVHRRPRDRDGVLRRAARDEHRVHAVRAVRSRLQPVQGRNGGDRAGRRHGGRLHRRPAAERASSAGP